MPRAGDEIGVVVDPDDPGHVIPLTAGTGWAYHWWIYTLLALAGVVTAFVIGVGKGQVRRAGRKALRDSDEFVRSYLVAVTPGPGGGRAVSGTDLDLLVASDVGPLVVPVRAWSMDRLPVAGEGVLLSAPVVPGETVVAVVRRDVLRPRGPVRTALSADAPVPHRVP